MLISVSFAGNLLYQGFQQLKSYLNMKNKTRIFITMYFQFYEITYTYFRQVIIKICIKFVIRKALAIVPEAEVL